MGLFGGKKHETVLVMELGSGGINGAFFLRKTGSVPLILDTVSREFPRRDVADVTRIKEDLFTALTDASKQLQRTFPGRPDKIYVVLGSPWSHAEIRTMEYQSKHDFRFTEKFGMKMVNAEMKKLSSSDPSRIIMDHRTIEVLLNGYTAENPNGKLCRVAQLRCLMSFASAEFLDAVRDSIHRTWRSSVSFTSSALSDSVVIRDLISGPGDMIILDVGAEETDVLLIGNGQISGTATFPIGERTIIRHAGGVLSKGAVETESLFSLMRSGSLDAGAVQKASDAFLASRENWQKSLKEVLQGLAPSRHLPSVVCFANASAMNEYLLEGMTSEFFPEFTTGYSGFNATIVDMNMLHGFVVWKEQAVRDSRIAMNTIFINRS